MFVRASRETSRRVFFGDLEGKKDGCILGEPTRRRPSRPTPPPRHALPRLDPPVVCPGIGFDRFILEAANKRCGGFDLFGSHDGRLELEGLFLLPEHAWLENELQRQIGVGTLVSSQERRAGFVPRINRLSADRQPRVFFLRRFT